MNFIEMFILSIFIIGIFISTYKFFRSHHLHVKRMRNLDEWSKFNTLLREWASEIEDVQVRHEFLHLVQSYLAMHDKEKSDWNSYIDRWSTEKEKEKVYKKWGKWIPSLTQEFRSKSLVSLLNN